MPQWSCCGEKRDVAAAVRRTPSWCETWTALRAQFDQGGVYMCGDLLRFYEEPGIQREPRPGYSPEGDGIADAFENGCPCWLTLGMSGLGWFRRGSDLQGMPCCMPTACTMPCQHRVQWSGNRHMTVSLNQKTLGALGAEVGCISRSSL
jgi:hypothetical protein